MRFAHRALMLRTQSLRLFALRVSIAFRKGRAMPEPLPMFPEMLPPQPLERPISFAAFARLESEICAAGYAGDIEWSERVAEPTNAGDFAQEAIFVICNSGMRFTVAQGIFDRIMPRLFNGGSSHEVFGHKGKCAAIDHIWAERERLLAEYLVAPDKLAFCESLPFIGGITKYHLAKNFGADVAKPDIHLQRLADWEGTDAQSLCRRLAKESGYRASTVDLILWRACAIGLINSRALASADTLPKGQDAKQGLAGTESGAVPKADAQDASTKGFNPIAR